MVVVEGRKPLCWSCKLLGHLSRTCPQKSAINSNINNNNSNINNSNLGKTTCPTTNPALDHPNKLEEGWTQVTRKWGKTPIHKTTEPATRATAKETTTKKAAVKTPEPTEPATSLQPLSQPPSPASEKNKNEKHWQRTAWGDGDLYKTKEVERQWGNQS